MEAYRYQQETQDHVTWSKQENVSKCKKEGNFPTKILISEISSPFLNSRLAFYKSILIPDTYVTTSSSMI